MFKNDKFSKERVEKNSISVLFSLQAPKPPEPYEGIRDGTKDSIECPQMDIFFQYYVGSEDHCLNLNIYTKEVSTTTWKLF